jgi:predicted phage terminase large subunit-like protein
MKTSNSGSPKSSAPTPDSLPLSNEELDLLLTELSRRQEKASLEKSLREYIKGAWQVVEPGTPYVDGWHIGAICEHLEAVTRGQIRKLLIAMPPRCMKSLTVSVFWPSWTWTFRPEHRWIFASFNEQLSIRDNLKTRDIIRSYWYQSRWPHVQLKSDQDTKHRFENTAKGFRYATSVGGATGEGGNTIVCDDPHALDHAYSEVERASANRWWSGTMSSRLNSRETSSRVVVGQRIHQGDLIGKLLAEGDWTALILPAEARPTKTYSSPIGWKDPRTEEGQLLWPERFDRKAQEEIKRESGIYHYSAQQQQDPAPAEGGMFSREYFRYFSIERGEVAVFTSKANEPKQFVLASLIHAQTFDTAIKTTEANDYTACATFAITTENDLLVLDMTRLRIPVPKQYAFTVQMRAKHPRIAYQFVEDRGSGQGLIQEAAKSPHPYLDLNERLKTKGITGLMTTDKQQRALPLSILFENAKVYFLAGASWLADLETELLHFPLSDFDDQVDALAYAAICLKFGPRSRQPSYASPSEPPRGAAPCGCRGLDVFGPGTGHHPRCDQHEDNRPKNDWQSELQRMNPTATKDWRQGFPSADWRSGT